MILHQTLKKERRKGRKHTLSMSDVLVRLAERECQQTEEALERYRNDSEEKTRRLISPKRG